MIFLLVSVLTFNPKVVRITFRKVKMNVKVDINVCRVCLKNDTGLSMYSEPTIIEKFQLITQLKVNVDDGMPSLLCERCVSRLKIAYEFKRQSIISESHLRSFINKINNEFKEVTSTTSATTKEVMMVNDEEMELLIEAGYKPDTVEIETTIIDPKIKDHMPIKVEDIHYIEDDFHGFIQEDDGGGNPFSDENEEEMHLEEEEEEEHISSDMQGGDSNECTEDQLQDETEETINETDVQDVSDIEIIENMPASPKCNELMDVPKNENRSHICIKCDKDFSTKTNLMRHMLTHDGVKPFQCTICGNGFTQNGSLKQHMLIHTGERPHKCVVCGRGFTQAKSLIFHMRRHTGEKPFTCDKCGLTFRQKDGLKRHSLMKHSDASAIVHICSICQRVLHSKYSLALHMKKHVGRSETNYKCDICDKSFSSKCSLENHNRQHTGEKPFKCEVCGKEFSRKGTLMTHSKVHMEEKPYKCQECDKSFIQKHQIMAHMQTHKNQPTKTFQCGKCYKSFAIKRNLLQHLRNHNRDSLTMYKCEECSIAFNTKRGLKLHRYNEHKETVSDLNECDICHIPFVSVNDLNNHTLVVHDAIDEKCEICEEPFTSKKLLEDHLLEHELMTIN